MYTLKQHTSIIIVSMEHHNIILVKLLRQVTRTSVEALFTGLNVVQQFTSDFIHVTYQGPNIRLTQLHMY